MITKNLLEQYYRLILHSETQRFAIAHQQGNEVKYPHPKNYLTDKDLEASITGDKSLGMMLIQDKTALTKSDCIDIDCPKGAIAQRA